MGHSAELAGKKISRDWPAPGKLNLFLHITGRRPDGYHELQTLFQFVEFGDTLSFSVDDGGEITRGNGPPGLASEDDLVVKAARALKAASGSNGGAHIDIEKRLPMGGGIGGGSSNAATTLVALNHLWKSGLSVDQLAEIGLELGADVPVFVRCEAAWAEGVGEHLSAFSPPECDVLVVWPGVSVPTVEIFTDGQLTRDTPPIRMLDFSPSRTRNDCEPVTRRLYPAVDEAMRWLGEISPAKMSGTGACVFADFATREAAVEVLDDLPHGWTGFATRRINQSPLAARLARETTG